MEQVIAERASKQRPRRITGDKVYDSDELYGRLEGKGVEHRIEAAGVSHLHRMAESSEHTKEDGRWSASFHGCLTFGVVPPDDYKTENFKAFLLLASAIILIG